MEIKVGRLNPVKATVKDKQVMQLLPQISWQLSGPKVFAYCSKNMSASDFLSKLGAHQMWSKTHLTFILSLVLRAPEHLNAKTISVADNL